MDAHVNAGHDHFGDVNEMVADARRKAREPVASHANAGQDHFADVSKMVSVGSGAARSVPDVHLTRFAAYFVALNADQSKPEVRTLARLVRHYGPYAPEFSDTAQERARSRPRGGPRRCGRRPEAVREALHPSGEVLGSTGDTPGERQGHAGGRAGDRWGNARDTSETAPQHARRCEVRHIRLPHFDQSRPPVLGAVHTRQHPARHHQPRAEPPSPVLQQPESTPSTPGPQCYPHWDAILRALLCHLVVTAARRCRL